MSEDTKKGIFIKPKAKGAPAASNLTKPKDVKKRWLAVGGVLIGVVVVSSTLFGDNKTRPPAKPQNTEEKQGTISVNPESNQKKAFEAMFAEQLSKLSEENRSMKQELQAQRQKLEEQGKGSAAGTGSNTAATLPPGIVAPPSNPANPETGSTNNLNRPPDPPSPIVRDPKGGIIDPGKATSPAGSSGGASSGGVPELNMNRQSGPKKFAPPEEVSSASPAPAKSGSALEQALSAGSNAAGAVAAKVNYKKNSAAGTLVAGSFAPISLLNGIDAGTSQATQSTPMPVLMNITDQATLPGSAKYKIKNCFVLGTGYGDLSAERVYIRTSRMSCVDKTNKLVLAQDVPGYIVDSDGKLGMRGVITDKQGAKLGKAMLAGFAQGLAGALGQAQSTVTSNALTGTTSTINGGAALRASGLSGAQNAINVLADTYVKEAQNLFPVITIDAGRLGTIVFTDTKALTWSDGDSAYVAETTPVGK